MKSSALSLSALMIGYRSLRSAAKSSLVSCRIRDPSVANVRSAAKASTMLVRLRFSTSSAAGKVSSVRPRLSLLRARMPANRSRPSAAAMMSLVWRSSELVSSASRGISSANVPSRPTTALYVSSVMSCNAPRLPLLTTMPSEDSTSSVLGYRAVFSSGICEPSTRRPTGLSTGSANSMCCEPSSDVCATLAMALLGRSTLLSRDNSTAAKNEPSSRCTASMPDTLPTVTSSTMTGEFCGSVVTFGSCTVIVYEPAPCPAVPGMSSELSPPNWQPANSTGSVPNAAAFRRPDAFRIIRPHLPAPQRGPEPPLAQRFRVRRRASWNPAVSPHRAPPQVPAAAAAT